jgi:hypothetical protein
MICRTVRPVLNLPHLPSTDNFRHQTPWVHQIANSNLFTNRPMKKKGGTAGIPRASGERNSPTGNGTFPINQVSFYLICIIPPSRISSLLSSLMFCAMIPRPASASICQVIHFSQRVVADENANARTAISAFRLYRENHAKYPHIFMTCHII